MHKSGDFIAITNSTILKAPVALKKYVRRFFKRKMIFGKDCWVAFRVTDIPGANVPGVAPSHSMDVNCFTEGLPKGTKLYDLIKKLEKDPRRCFTFCTDWDDGCSGSVISD
ncbi:MAG: hypothetical protein WCT41_03905 [Candidatus Paceibacterota bacterium]|jgi:hypothetical protein